MFIRLYVLRHPVYNDNVKNINEQYNFFSLIPCAMGANASQLEKDIGSDLFPPNEHYFGLVNFGNTCYSNSVLQALYFCKPFRDKVLEYKAKNKRTKETLLTCLADLFYRYIKNILKISLFFKKSSKDLLCPSEILNC